MTLLSVREVLISIPGPVKSDAAVVGNYRANGPVPVRVKFVTGPHAFSEFLSLKHFYNVRRNFGMFL